MKDCVSLAKHPNNLSEVYERPCYTVTEIVNHLGLARYTLYRTCLMPVEKLKGCRMMKKLKKEVATLVYYFLHKQFRDRIFTVNNS